MYMFMNLNYIYHNNNQMINENELMICDWVRIMDDALDRQYLNDYKPGQVVKVSEILNYGINPDWCGAEVNDLLHLDIIEPIPITPEILEKIGFLKIGDLYCINEDYYDVSIDEYTDSIWRVEYDDLEFNFPTRVNLVGFVHELQHVLRLCGISKEIEL